MTFFLDIWQLIEAICASHFLQRVHCEGSWAKSFVFSECVNVNFERLLGISGSLDLTISRFRWIWVWVQKKEESTFCTCFGRFPRKLRDIKRVAKLALKDGRLKLVTEGHALKLYSLLPK